MKISARNQIAGTITAITRGAVSGQIKIDKGGSNVMPSSHCASRRCYLRPRLR
jgi:molybdopterin-binding protein